MMSMSKAQQQQDSGAFSLPFHYAKNNAVFISASDEQTAEITHTASMAWQTMIELQRLLKKPLSFRCVEQSEFENLLAAAYESGTDSAMAAINGLEDDLDLSELAQSIPVTEDLLESQDDAPVIRLLNAILTQAIKQSASDIHFETFETKFLVRFRMDGVLHEILQPPRTLAALLTSRLKVMAKLDIAEKRLPQDGRISLRIAGRTVDVRVSTIPTHYGERIVLRLLDKQSAPLDLLRLGMSKQTLAVAQQLIATPHGIILVTGPTGSGKTT